LTPRVTQDDDFLRRRLVRFGLLSGALSLLALAFRVPRLLFTPGPSGVGTYAWHFVSACVALSIAPLCHFLGRTRAILRTIEAIAVPTSALCLGLMGRAIETNHPNLGIVAQLVVLLAVMYGAFGRAVLVPSSGMRTFLITTACLPGITIARTGAVTLGVSPFADPTGSTTFLGAVAGALMWWSIATIIATLASDVIYGLRKEVQTVRQYGQYMLEEKIGEGGMGDGYRASHSMLRRPTALKLLPPSRAGGTSVAKFEKEVRLTARLTHPNTVTIFDYGRTPAGVFYYAMELIDGETLEDIVATTGPLPPARAVRVARQLVSALAEAHEMGLVHRDVKPANVMLCAVLGGEPDVAKVLDFGLVRDQIDPANTGRTTLAGTPLYMSPEAITDPASVSGASDLYAVGAVVYFLLTGEPVFDALTTVEIYASHLHNDAVAPSRRTQNTIPPELDALVLGCLEKSPSRRPSSARDLACALAEIERKLAGEAWPPARAAAWWQEHRETIATHRKSRTTRPTTEPSSSHGRTLEIDFIRR
jgi:eukaryotic-like serine/threonine-protein kinase